MAIGGGAIGVACSFGSAARMTEQRPPSKRRKPAVEEDEVEVNVVERSGGGLTSDAHISEEKIQASQLAKQPFNIWHHGEDETDSAEVGSRTEPTTTDSVVSRGMPSLTSTVHVPTGRGTTVAILDSGINVDHSAFKQEDGVFKISQHSRSFVGGDCRDTLGHGTQCAGLLCGSPDTIVDGGTDKMLPFCGIAPSAKVMVCKVVRDGTEIADIEAVCDALDYICNYNKSCIEGECIDAKVDVISLSFGMTGFHHKLTSKIQEALYNGIIVVCAASNNGKRIRKPITYPARLGDVLCIGACTANGKPADFSPVGRELDFLAQGETIWAPTLGGNAYTIVNGTSFAAPLVAGIVCWLIEDLRRLSGPDGGGLLLCERTHNVWCMRELLREMAAGEHNGESGCGMLHPNEYFDKDDNEKLRIITKKVLNNE